MVGPSPPLRTQRDRAAASRPSPLKYTTGASSGPELIAVGITLAAIPLSLAQSQSVDAEEYTHTHYMDGETSNTKGLHLIHGRLLPPQLGTQW